MVEIVLVFAHVTSTHLSILVDQVFEEVPEQAVISHREGLHERSLLVERNGFRHLSHCRDFVCNCRLLDFLAHARLGNVVLKHRLRPFAVYAAELVKLRLDILRHDVVSFSNGSLD